MLREGSEDWLPILDSAASGGGYAEIEAERQRAGRTVSVFECRTTAIACFRSMAVTTCNIGDFEGRCIEIQELGLLSIERGGPIGAWIVDDTGLPEKDKHSVGMARQ